MYWRGKGGGMATGSGDRGIARRRGGENVLEGQYGEEVGGRQKGRGGNR